MCKGPEAEQSSMTSRSKKHQCFCSIMNKGEGCPDESRETKPRVTQASWATLKNCDFILIVGNIIRTFLIRSF